MSSCRLLSAQREPYKRGIFLILCILSSVSMKFSLPVKAAANPYKNCNCGKAMLISWEQVSCNTELQIQSKALSEKWKSADPSSRQWVTAHKRKNAPQGTRRNQSSLERWFFFFSLSINGLWKSLAGNDSTFLLCCWKRPISTSRCHNGWGWIWLFLVSTRYTRCERTKRPRPKWEMAKGPLSIAFWIQSLELFLKRRNASWASRGVRISSRKLGVSLKLRAREETDVLYFFFSKSFRK